MRNRMMLVCVVLLGTATAASAHEEASPRMAGGGMILQALGTRSDGRNEVGFMQGGRGFHYVGDGRLRLGGLGLRGSVEGRALAYGGFTAEYVLRPWGGVEFPVGLLLGAGGREDAAGGANPLALVVPMLAFEVNALPWLKLGLNANATLGLGLRDTPAFVGIGGGVHLAFGRFGKE